MLGSIRGISRDEDVFFVDQLVFYYNNCPEVPKGTFPFSISIFPNSVEFVDQVQRLSMDVERLATVSIGEHRYDPDFPTRKHFEGFSADPFISKHLLPWIELMNPLLNPTTATLRKAMFEQINAKSYQLGYTFDLSFTIHQYIINVMDRLMTMFAFLTDKKTPLIIRPARCPVGWVDDTHEDMRYTSDQMIADYHQRLETLDKMQLEDGYEMENPYLQHSLEELVSYRLAMKQATPTIRHSNAVVFAYCMQRWCELIHSYYFDIEFYKKIRPDQNKPNSTFILNDVCKVVMQIESIMLYVMEKTKEMISERMALQAISPEDGPSLLTSTMVVKGQTAELRNGTVTVNDVISLLHKSGF